MNPNRMAPGQYQKEEGDKLYCEKCQQEAPMLFEVYADGTARHYCEACFKQYWLDRGYKR